MQIWTAPALKGGGRPIQDLDSPLLARKTGFYRARLGFRFARFREEGAYIKMGIAPCSQGSSLWKEPVSKYE